jgi:hypothetical protein
MRFCKPSSIMILWAFSCCSRLFKSCLQVWLMVLLSFYNSLHCWKLHQWHILSKFSISSLYLVALPFLMIVLQLFYFDFVKQGLRFRVWHELPHVVLFIYNLCKFKRWYHAYLEIHRMVTTFINNLFQIMCSPLSVAFIMVLSCFQIHSC